MKPRKRVPALFIMIIFMIMFSSVVDARPHGRRHHGGGGDYYNRGGQNCVGAPLDGGLLALLAGAGIVYFTARKKRKNIE
jgi:hypothetical protein